MKHFFVIAVYSVYIACNAFAIETLTWQDCVRLAYQNNPAIKALIHDNKAAEYSIKQAQSGFYPNINVISQLQNSYSEATHLTTETQTISSSVNIELFSGFKTVNELQIAKLNFQISNLNAELTKINILQDIRLTFLKALYAQRTLEILKLINNKLQQNVEFIKLRYEGGQEPRWSYLKAQTDLEQGKWELQKAQDNYAALKNQLAQLIGYEQDFEIFNEEIKMPEPPSLEVLINNLDNHVEIKIKKLEKELINLHKKLQQSTYWPTVTAFYNYSYNRVETDPFKKQWSIGIGLTLPLFSGFKTYYSVEELNQKIEKQNLLNLNFIQNKKSEIEEYYNQYVNNLRFLNISQQNLQAAEERLNTVEKEYQVGLSSFFEWDQAQNLYIMAQKNLINAQKDAAMSYVMLNKSCGRLD